MDLLTRKVTRGGRAIDLRPQEFKLLEYLMRHAGEVVTRTMLFEGVWDFHFDPQTNVVDVHISRLRQKVDKGFGKPLIHTHRGGRYCIRADGQLQNQPRCTGCSRPRPSASRCSPCCCWALPWRCFSASSHGRPPACSRVRPTRRCRPRSAGWPGSSEKRGWCASWR